MLLHVTSFFIFMPKKVWWCPHGAHPVGTPSRLSPLSPLFFLQAHPQASILHFGQLLAVVFVLPRLKVLSALPMPESCALP